MKTAVEFVLLAVGCLGLLASAGLRAAGDRHRRQRIAVATVAAFGWLGFAALRFL
jgi:hypothetical protein